jgi:hypothetical protein
MIYAVIKNQQVISVLFSESQQQFLKEQDSSLTFFAVNVIWDEDNPVLPNQLVVLDDGTVTLASTPTE